LGSSKTSKNDSNDALSAAIAGLRHCGLRSVDRDGHSAVLRLLADRHHDLSGQRTQSACRLRVLFRELTAGGARCVSPQPRHVNSSTRSRSRIQSTSSVDVSPRRVDVPAAPLASRRNHDVTGEAIRELAVAHDHLPVHHGRQDALPVGLQTSQS